MSNIWTAFDKSHDETRHLPIGKSQGQARKEAAFEEAKDQSADAEACKICDEAVAHADEPPAELHALVCAVSTKMLEALTVIAGMTRLNCSRLTRTDVGNSARI